MAIFWLTNTDKLEAKTIESINQLLKLWYGKQVVLDVNIYNPKRTNPQNNYLHKLLRLFAKGLTDLGYRMSMEDLKFELKEKGFFGWKEYQTKDGIKKRGKDTHELTTTELSEAIEAIKESASKYYDIYLPDAEEIKI